MKFSINRELLLKPLLLVSGAVERKSTLPILGNILFEISKQSLTMTATDLELEMVAYADIDNQDDDGKLQYRQESYLIYVKAYQKIH